MTTDTPLELTVCTVARTADAPVARWLDALAHQSAPSGSYDVVIVDATAEGSISVPGAGALPVRVVRVAAEASHGDALNAGWRAATAPGVGFLAVDFVPA